jgi:hypothetical protein
MHIEKGDFVTFASIAYALDVLPFNMWGDYFRCEIQPGIYRRHADLEEHESRSDISRDGYMGVIFECVVLKNQRKLKDIIKAGWKNRWTMGDRGNFDYLNIWPLIPTLYAAAYGKWIPTLPTLILDKPEYTTGFRAHLTALHIMTEMEMGKRRWSHRRTLKLLLNRNPDNPWFEALYVLAMGWNSEYLEFKFNMEEAAYGWGSCPGIVFKALTLRAVAMGMDDAG